MDDRDVDAVLAAYQRWADSVGQGAVARAQVRAVGECRAFLRDVTASYRIWWRWTDTGRAWWVVLTIVNRTDQTLGGTTSGRGTARGALEMDFESPNPTPIPGSVADPHFGWGGGSADSLEAPPGTSRRLADIGPFQNIHTAADGDLQVDEANIFAGTEKMTTGCALPVPEAP